MVDDHRQDVANLIARWAADQFVTDLVTFDYDRAHPNYLAYRLADAIVSNHCDAGQGVELEVPAQPHVPYLDN